jgi:integrase
LSNQLFGPKRGLDFADETGRAIDPRTDWDGWKRLLATAGVRDGRLHDARHTAATDLLLLGVHERTIMSVLGRPAWLVNHRDVEPLHARNYADPQ